MWGTTTPNSVGSAFREYVPKRGRAPEERPIWAVVKSLLRVCRQLCHSSDQPSERSIAQLAACVKHFIDAGSEVANEVAQTRVVAMIAKWY